MRTEMHATVNTCGLDIVLPAGGRISGDFADRAGADVKALIRIGGITLLERLLGVVRSIESVRRIVVVGPEEVTAASALADAVIPEGSSGPENILRGIDWLDKHGGLTSPRILIMTTDLPFVARNDIEGFLDVCSPDMDLCAPIIGMREFEARFPGSTNIGVRLKDGVWTMGCLFLADPTALIRNRGRIEQVFTARKSQFAMVRLLGLPFVARFLTRGLSVAHIERRCSELLGCMAGAVRGCSPALAFDIDGPGDYRYAVQQTEGAGQ